MSTILSPARLVKVFAAPAFQHYPNFKSIIRDFKTYKQNDIVEFTTMIFGKDVTFNRPQLAVDAELAHVHLLPIESKKNTSDRFLV